MKLFAHKQISPICVITYVLAETNFETWYLDMHGKNSVLKIFLKIDVNAWKY